MNSVVSRRGFLKTSAAALVIGFTPKGLLAAGNGEAAFNPFVRVAPDGTVTVLLKHFEMGQGTTTGLTTLVAEELDADWAQMAIDFAPADAPVYKNLLFNSQGTGGSTAISNSYEQYRKAGAAARDVLVRAAAKKWDVDPAGVTVEKGVIKAGGRTATFGEAAAAAAGLTAPENPKLKTLDQFSLIGKRDLPRKDSHAKTNGTAIFAMDVKLPGQIYAAVKRSPKFGGKLKSFNADAAKNVFGFIDAKALPNGAGVAVFGKNTWAAFQARDAIEAKWDFSAAETRSTDQMISDTRKSLNKPEFNVIKSSSPAAAARAYRLAPAKLEAEYIFPNLAHAPMEPLNCVIEPAAAGGVRLHDGCQFPSITQPVVAGVLGLKQEQVEIKTVYAGGSFGRRANPASDYHSEAAMAFDLLGRKTPVKLVWSREDDLTGGYYRPLVMHRAQVGLGASGGILGWNHRIAGKSILKGTLFEPVLVHDGVDETSVEGVKGTLYNIPEMAIGLSDVETPMTALWWRSVGHTHTAYVMETMIDRVAEARGGDPVSVRHAMLSGGGADQVRMRRVLDTAAKLSDWSNTPVKEGDTVRAKGIAIHKSFGSYVGMVARVAVTGKTVKVEKIWCSVDCGVAINPDVIKAQMEGGIGYALGAALLNEVTLADGEVEQSNFPDYEPLRLSGMPDVEVEIVASDVSPTGVGEPGVPPAAPAVANAIYAASGVRITRLPFTKAGFEFS